MTSLLPGATEKAEWGSVLPPGLPYSSSSPVYENIRPVFAGQGRLYGFSGYSSRGSTQFVLCFDLARLPANGDTACVWITVPTVANFSAYWGSSGRWFLRGCWLANSSTAPTLTLGSADTAFDAQYVPLLGDPLHA